MASIEAKAAFRAAREQQCPLSENRSEHDMLGLSVSAHYRFWSAFNLIKGFSGCTLEKLDEEPAHLIWLLLLNPMSGSINKMGAAHLRTGGALHPLECAGILEDAPVALTADK
jgi:hypothetical protein